MPIYELENTESQEHYDVIMSWDDLQEHINKNPHLRRVPTAAKIVSGIAGVTHKVDSGFKDVLNRIGNANPHSPMGHEHGDRGIKASKTREVVAKHKAK